VPYPSAFSRGELFFIEASSLVDGIGVDHPFGHGTVKTPSPDPFRTTKGRPPEKPDRKFDGEVLKWYDLTVSVLRLKKH
jgi:hypothetical protein